MVNISLHIPDLILQLLVFILFIWVISLTTGKMVTDLARVKYLEIDGTFNVKIKLVSNITP
jgi:hypothetical protein